MANAVEARRVTLGAGEDGRAGRWIRRTGMVAVVMLVAALFWLNWKIQFAAPPGYLFDMPTPEAEAGYCLAVAQDFGRDPVSAEVADFWVSRLVALKRGMGGPIAEGRAALARDLGGAAGGQADYLRSAMLACADRTVTYGAHLRQIR